MKKALLPIVYIILFSVFISETGCKKTSTTTASLPPALTTQDVMLDVTTTTAQSGGTITSVGSSALTENGVCYSTTNHTPTIGDTKTTAPLISTSYTFICNITGLTANTTYYLRAYATSAVGTSYGSVVKFTTSSTVSSVSGVVTTFAGSQTSGYADGTGAGALFNGPGGMATDAQGNVYVSDSFNNLIRKITPAGVVTTIAGNGTPGYADGPAASAQFYGPQGLAVDAQGNIFVADFGNNVIRKISTDGTVSTYCGNTSAGAVNGAATVAEFNGPYGIAFDKSGNLYVADDNNNMIRMINSSGVASTVAGVTRAGYGNATTNTTTGVFAFFRRPSGVAVDPSTGNIYVADGGNSAIRQVTPAGVVTTIAGGPGQTSLIGYPTGIAVDQNANIYITDQSGRIIELTATRTLYDLAGGVNVAGYADGTGTAAQFNTPLGIAADTQGNIYVSDFNNNMIRKLTVTVTN
ncbi:MAG TPA: NHL repeat-containing protein [Mucilaginibacter sp.]|nr:NHL repeat-containing protein [Mucilaginibacter sp.]